MRHIARREAIFRYSDFMNRNDDRIPPIRDWIGENLSWSWSKIRSMGAVPRFPHIPVPHCYSRPITLILFPRLRMLGEEASARVFSVQHGGIEIRFVIFPFELLGSS